MAADVLGPEILDVYKPNAYSEGKRSVYWPTLEVSRINMLQVNCFIHLQVSVYSGAIY